MTSELVNAVEAAGDGLWGTWQFHGEWFGRPFDNQHRIVGATDLADGVVEIHLADPTERLVVRGVEGVDRDPFTIARVSRLEWHWTWYGRPDLPENRASIVHDVHRLWVTVTTTGPGGTERHRLRARGRPAVVLVHLG